MSKLLRLYIGVGTAKWLQYYIGGGMPKLLQYYIGGGVSRDPQKWLRNMCTTPYDSGYALNTTADLIENIAFSRMHFSRLHWTVDLQ